MVKVVVEDVGVLEDFFEYKDRLKGNVKFCIEILVFSELLGLVLLCFFVVDKVLESWEVIDEEV